MSKSCRSSCMDYIQKPSKAVLVGSCSPEREERSSFDVNVMYWLRCEIKLWTLFTKEDIFLHKNALWVSETTFTSTSQILKLDLGWSLNNILISQSAPEWQTAQYKYHWKKSPLDWCSIFNFYWIQNVVWRAMNNYNTLWPRPLEWLSKCQASVVWVCWVAPDYRNIPMAIKS